MWVEAVGEVEIAGSVEIDACVSRGCMATYFSASWCAAGGEPSGATPEDGGESKDMPPMYTKISHAKGRATKTDRPKSEPL